jgi:hypothetical protein
MIRLAWRQFRTQAAVAAGALVVLAVILAITGSRLVHLYDTTVVGCTSHGGCADATNAFLSRFGFLQRSLGPLMLLVPVLLGIFWGAPLIAGELEAGTHRLAWTQSVTRTRWLAAKLSLVGSASMIIAGLLSLLTTWWWSPIDRLTMDRFGPGTFDERAIVAVGYAAFAFALGAAAGLLIRRTLPAMAVTLVLFVAARLAFVHWIRPYLIPPLHKTIALTRAAMGIRVDTGGTTTLTIFPVAPRIPNAWAFSPRIVDASGRAQNTPLVTHACPKVSLPNRDAPGGGGGPGAVLRQLSACLKTVARTYHETVAYQPGSRFWAFQWMETAIFVAVALGLAGLCFWWIRKRVS